MAFTWDVATLVFLSGGSAILLGCIVMCLWLMWQERNRW